MTVNESQAEPPRMATPRAPRPQDVVNHRELMDCAALRSRLEAGELAVDVQLGRQRRTMLHIAVLSFRPDLVELLLEFSADPFLEDTMGSTPYSLCNELREAARAGGSEVDEAPLAARLDSIAGSLEFPMAMQNLFFDCQGLAPAKKEEGMPPAPSPLIRLTSTGRRVRPPPLPPPPLLKKLTRGTSVEGASRATPCADLAAAQAALERRLEEGVQVFSDAGLWCLLSLQERDVVGPRHAEKQETGCEGPVCGICFEAKGSDLMIAPCSLARCRGRFCKDCLTSHVRHSVGDLRYSLPLVRCPECRRRVPTRVWEPLLADSGESQVSERIKLAGKALLKVRCPNCHGPKDLFQISTQSTDGQAEIKLGECVLDGLPEEQRRTVAKEAVVFLRGGLGDRLLDALETEEERQAPPQLVDVGHALPRAPPPSLTSRFRNLCGLLGDAERVTSLMLAFYRRYPLIKTPCCKADMCFKCKVKGHHAGQTCDQRQAKELSIEAQFCPGCGVPTVKSEGCNHIVCVCGASWQWNTS